MVWANVTRDGYYCSMTVQEAYKQISVALTILYEQREASNIAGMVIEHITGFSKSSRIVHKHDHLSRVQKEKLQQITTELNTKKPVQYVLQNAPFYGMELYVDENVLIPRPETEELVEWILQDVGDRYSEINLLDIGTGSGCIAIALQKNLPRANVYATDISAGALTVAQKNASQQNAAVRFSKMDILNEEQWKSFPLFDYIVSNPPYIAENEAWFMNDNVLQFEPPAALFVPDKNPLQFYDTIGSFGLQHLTNNGKLFFEINEAYGKETITLLLQKGYQNIELKKDLQGKDRMVKAEL